MASGAHISPNTPLTFVGINLGQFCVMSDEHVKRSRHFTLQFIDMNYFFFKHTGSRYKVISTHAKTPATAGQKKKTKLAMQLSMGEPAGRLRTSSASSVELLDEKALKSGKKTRKLPQRGKQKELNVLSGESDIEGSKIKKKQKSRKTGRESHEPNHEKSKRKSGKFLSRFGRSHKKKMDSENMSALANGNGHPAFEREISKQGKFKEVAGEVSSKCYTACKIYCFLLKLFFSNSEDKSVDFLTLIMH